MGAKMKGIYKSFKYISQIFVVKEREMEIGYPTDVKHVAHIGWDGDSANAPSWMKEFKTASDFSASSLNNGGNRRNPSRWSSQDFDHSIGYQPMSETFQDSPSTDSSRGLRKHKRKKNKSSSSLSSPKESSNPSRSSRTSKPKAAYVATVANQLEAATSNLQGVFH